MRLQFPVIRLISDNFDGYVTKEAYKELRLQMSTGEFHMHQHIDVIAVDPMTFAATEYLYEFDHKSNELYEMGSLKNFLIGEK